MEIIDFERDGRAIRFFLGEKEGEWGYTRPDYKDYTGEKPEWLKPSGTYYGDDWDDHPYQCNAGTVYEEFIKGYIDVVIGFDNILVEPDEYETNYCKDDFVNDKNLPCLIVVKGEEDKDPRYIMCWEFRKYGDLIKDPDTFKIHFGDSPDIFHNNEIFHVLEEKYF